MVIMRIPPSRCKLQARPNMYIWRVMLSYVDEFKYLEHIINHDLSDDDDTDLEGINLAMTGNVLIRRAF